MSSIFRLPKCPYCRRNVTYLSAYFLKSKGEFTCDNCKGLSDVVINRKLYAVASGVCILDLIILLLYSAMGDHGSLLGLLFVILPFLAFYAVVPFFVRLQPTKDSSAVKRIRPRRTVPTAAVVSETAKTDTVALNAVSAEDLSMGDDFTAKFMSAKKTLRGIHADDEGIEDISMQFDRPKEDIFSGANLNDSDSE